MFASKLVENPVALVAVDLAAAMARVDLEEPLAGRVVLSPRELRGKGGAGRRVDPPTGAVGDHQAREPPVRQLCEEFRRGIGAFLAVGGKCAFAKILRTNRGFSDFPRILVEVEGAPGIR